MFEAFFDKLQSYFGEKIIQIHYVDTDSFVLSIKSNNVIKDLKNLNEIFGFGNLNKNHELYSNKNEKVIGKFKTETPKNVFIDEFNCLRSKVYSFECGSNDKNKLKVIWISTKKY